MVETLKTRVHEILDRHGLDYELAWELSGKPFLTPKAELANAMSNAITQVTTLEPLLSTSGGTSDGRFIADICPQVIEFGPLNATIHKLNEYVAVDDIEHNCHAFISSSWKIYWPTKMKQPTQIQAASWIN